MADTQAELAENGYKDELSPELQERAELYAGEDPKHRDLILGDLMTTLTRTVPDVPMNESRLLRFLRACQFKIRQTAATVKEFYKYKANNPNLFAPLTEAEARNIVHTGIIGVLPGRDVQGGRVLYMKIGLWDPDFVSMTDLFRLAISLHLKLIQDPETQIGGFRTLNDIEGLSFKHAMKLSIPELRKVSKFYEEAFPARFDGLHNVNDSVAIDRTFTLVKPFISPRLRSLYCFHGENYETLHEFIAPENLPERYGGSVTDDEIQDYTMSLLNDYDGDDFGGPGQKISKMEDKVSSDSVVSASASGSWRKLGSS